MVSPLAEQQKIQETNMSMDNTSHPSRPGPDELVPSRYALRVGEIDVLVVSDGALPPRGINGLSARGTFRRFAAAR